MPEWLVKKHQTKLTPEIDNRILSLFSHGMSYTAIKDHIAEIYQLEVSEATISSIADSLSHSLKLGNPHSTNGYVSPMDAENIYYCSLIMSSYAAWQN